MSRKKQKTNPFILPVVATIILIGLVFLNTKIDKIVSGYSTVSSIDTTVTKRRITYPSFAFKIENLNLFNKQELLYISKDSTIVDCNSDNKVSNKTGVVISWQEDKKNMVVFLNNAIDIKAGIISLSDFIESSSPLSFLLEMQNDKFCVYLNGVKKLELEATNISLYGAYCIAEKDDKTGFLIKDIQVKK